MKTFLNIFLLVFFCSGIFSCQSPPTKGTNQGQVSAEKGEDPFQGFLNLKPVVLDARSPLDFSVSHAPGAILVQWPDFNKLQPGYRGILQEDEASLARRLSLWGIDPETAVLVVGSGLNGQGEEGRVAWMLKYLGVKNVQFASWLVIRATIPRPENGPANKPTWKPAVQSQYQASPEEFKAAVFDGQATPSKARLKSLQMNSINAGALGPEVMVLDVRDSVSSEAALEKTRVPVKRISWKKFINSKGLPETSVQSELKEENITKNRQIFVISEKGVSSATVTLILREWGFQAKNFSGGFEFLQRALE